MQDFSSQCRLKKETIGFVPTMGALHAGHVSLIKRSVHENRFTIVSIFVNPLQFGPKEDLDKYPRPFKEDIKICRDNGVDAVFHPDAKTFYKTDHLTFVGVEKMSEYLCGKSRPNHFRGVTTVVTKLFNSVQPDRAYFGQKDYQQETILRKMVMDLDIPVKIVVCPIIREKSGLAMSSRNKYLSPSEKERALILSQSLEKAQTLVNSGEKNADNLIHEVQKLINSHIIKNDKVDYIEIIDPETLERVSHLSRKAVISLAVYIGKTRLIDNKILKG